MADRSNRLVCARGANRTGKSRHAAWVVSKEGIDLPLKLGRPARIRIVGPNQAQAQGVIGRYLAEFLRGHLSSRSYWTGTRWNSKDILLTNGTVIQIRSMEDDPQTMAGDELDLCVIDEVPKRAIFAECLARLGSVRGRMIIVMTPIDRPTDWLRKMVEADDSPWTQLVAAYTPENVPWTTADEREEHLENMRASAWQWAQRVEGAWDGVSDERMLSGFADDSVTTDDPAGDVTLGLTFDHGVLAGKTVALLWAESGQWVYVCDEFIADRAMTPEAVAEAVVNMLGRHGFALADVSWAVGDINVSGHTGHKINAELERELKKRNGGHRLPFRIRAPYKRAGSIHYGIRLINYAFSRYDLRIHSRCTQLVDACKHWQGGKTGSDGLLSDRIDALRYGALRVFAPRKTYAVLRSG